MLFIGNQTSCWAATATEPFEYAIENGFDAFEWFPDKKPQAGWDERDLDEHARRTLAESARARGIQLSVHARLLANPLTEEGRALLQQDVELARALGARLLNIHLAHEQGITSFVKAILPLVRRTAELELQLAVENTPLHSPEQFNEFFAALRNAGAAKIGHVGMCFDLGHANLCSATRNDYLAFFDRLEPSVPLIHLHFHENWGDADSHLPLFTGPAGRNDSGIRGLLARLKQRGFNGSVILEQWPQPPSLLKDARDRLLQLWGPQDKPSHQENRPAPPPPSLGPENTVPPQELADELIAGNQRARSWREKLDFVRGLLSRRGLKADDLIDISIYLRFLSTGQIACVEDGRHFRPAHHARIASEISEVLGRLATPENAFIVRKIYPWLPSSDSDFQRPEPLTRIRDIAHRNDIPSELKREIKTTLQNKLHRCAGPEDLATSAAILERITAAGAEYSPAFIEQFRIFHEELKEFFNAQSLDQRLEAVRVAANGEIAALIERFLKQKNASSPREQLNAFETLTTLRRSLLEFASRKSGAESQSLVLADIGLEDFAFVLVSRLLNACAAPENSASALATEVDALKVALDNLVLSGIEPDESRIVAAELRAWGAPSAQSGRDELLRFKVTCLRCRRLAEKFSTRLIALFSARAQRLGRALGVAESAIRVFCEGEIRGQLIFQVSKLTADLLRWVRQQLNSPAWDVLVPGRTSGRLLILDSIEDWRGNAKESTIVLLRNAAGDEEIPRNVSGVVLAHEMPHLSHLAVRARQAGIVFVACEEPAEFERLRRFERQVVSLAAAPDEVTFKPGPQENAQRPEAPRHPVRIPAARLSAEISCIPLEQAVAENAGGKAVGARYLAEVSRHPRAQFQTPASVVVPFGVMEAIMSRTPAIETRYRELVKRAEGLAGSELSRTARAIRELIQRIEVPALLQKGPAEAGTPNHPHGVPGSAGQVSLSSLARAFSPNSALVVRSSANCEDLAELAGAGLYESVINVPLSGAGEAIRTVWASLWTERAAQSRKESGVPHSQAHMAVLLQELVTPDFAFVLHTVNPLTRNENEVYAEIVVGLGETLVSGASAGNPYRLVCGKNSDKVSILAFANFSHASRPRPGGGLSREMVDYSRVELSRDPAALLALARRLGQVGHAVEQAFRAPQDIEGAVVRDKIYLVQSRPQQGLAPQT